MLEMEMVVAASAAATTTRAATYTSATATAPAPLPLDDAESLAALEVMEETATRAPGTCRRWAPRACRYPYDRRLRSRCRSHAKGIADFRCEKMNTRRVLSFSW
jgi:hypothetical protein